MIGSLLKPLCSSSSARGLRAPVSGPLVPGAWADRAATIWANRGDRQLRPKIYVGEAYALGGDIYPEM